MKNLKLKAAARTAIQLVSITIIALALVWFETIITAEMAGWILMFGFLGFAIWMVYMINLSHFEHLHNKTKEVEEKQSKGDLK
jgi:hypothetical protein